MAFLKEMSHKGIQIAKITRLQELQSHSVKTPDCWAEMLEMVGEKKV